MVAAAEPALTVRAKTSEPGATAAEQGRLVGRLRMLATLFATLCVLIFGLLVFVRGSLGDAIVMGNPWFEYLVLGIGLLVSVLLVIATFASTWPPGRVLGLGLAFQVFGALCISLVEQQITSVAVSVVCVWILSFTIVPSSPRRAAAAAYLAALTGPAALVMHVLVGGRDWPPAITLLGFTMSFVSAAIAVGITRVIYGLGREVADARQLGAYHLVEKLGQGGMGEVWRAEHVSLVRPAAVKLLRRGLTSHLGPVEMDALNTRFRREVQATALLSSPHTVAVFDFGQASDGSLYYVMELLRGFDAEVLVRDFGPQPAERVIHLLRQVCASLDEAHDRELIHRDIKPANLNICAVGMELDFVKVLDFGLVHHIGSDLRLTNENSIAGTPAYLAPESALHNRFDARSDIYALGCVAYWLLTGSLVFQGETAAGLMAAHIHDLPVPPSKRSELPIPPALEALVMSMLAKDPAARPQGVAEIAARLDAIEVACPWTQARAEAWWRAHLPELVRRARIGEPSTMHETRVQRPAMRVRERAAACAP